MRRAQWILLLSVGLFFSACQTPRPTQVRQTVSPIETPASYAARILEQKPVILDVRSDIDFGVSHVPGSVNVHWEDLNAPQQGGLLELDRFSLARRLALWGIDPKTPVLILGLGPEGRGEEGRVGWALRVLGLSKVETATIRLFTPQNPREGETRPANKAVWKPQTKNQLEISPNEFKKTVASGISTAQGQPLTKVVLDLSHPNEKGVKGLQQITVTWPVHRASWRQFYDEHGRGSCSQAMGLFNQLNLSRDAEILFVDVDGVGAAAAAFVLESCSIGKSRVLSTGLMGLRSKR